MTSSLRPPPPDSVTQISARLIDERGRLTESVLAERAVRCAILADLVTARALRKDADEIEIEHPPGLLPLAESLVWWAHHDGIDLKDAADQMVELGLWERHGDHLDLEHHNTWRDGEAGLARRLCAATADSSGVMAGGRSVAWAGPTTVGGPRGPPPALPALVNSRRNASDRPVAAQHGRKGSGDQHVGHVADAQVTRGDCEGSGGGTPSAV